ncbi:MAG: putative metal-dependent hydrolase [Kiritimatiellia bacterium]|jgi:predicted metal-dependent hydrolase
MQVRRMRQDYSSVSRWWYDGNPVLSHVVNGMNMLFPDGERFFIRSVKHYLPRLKSPELRHQVRAFFAQEAMHGAEHDRALLLLREQGLELDDWLNWYRGWAFRRLERWSPAIVNLAITAALEHFTASFAQFALTSGHLDLADPVMAYLMRWHAAEEIEHKAVAYDVYCAVGGGYLVRVFGLFFATAVFLIFWRSATAHLLQQEPDLDRAAIRRHTRRIRERGLERDPLMFQAFFAYLRPGFHPNDLDNRALAEDWLDSVGRLYG